MYSNQWLNLCRFYFAEYKKKVVDIVHPEAEIYFIIDAPRDADLEVGYPGASILVNDKISLGEMVKRDADFSILNVCSVPLQKTTGLDNKYNVLFEVLTPLVKEGYSEFSNHENEDVNKFEKAVLYDFKNRLIKAGCLDKPCKIIVYGEFAKTYFEQIDDVNMKCEVSYVNDVSFLQEMLKIK